MSRKPLETDAPAPKKKAKKRKTKKLSAHARYWRALGPGIPYDCPEPSSYIGRVIPRKKSSTARYSGCVVTSCATPIWTKKLSEAHREKTKRKPKRGEKVPLSLKPKPQFALRCNGINIVLPQSIVREQFRTPRGVVTYELQDPDRIEADYLKTGIPSPAGVPYPIRPGSSICVWDHPFWVNLYEMIERRERLRASKSMQELFIELPYLEAVLAKQLEIAKEYQKACLAAVRDYLAGKKGKAVFSAARERAQDIEALKKEGVDTASAAYLDALKANKTTLQIIKQRAAQRASRAQRAQRDIFE